MGRVLSYKGTGYDGFKWVALYGIDMQDIVVSVAERRDDWTPKQKENWENYGKPTVDQLSGDAEKWYLRTYRPKKRGDGLMERDHVQIGEPEHYFVKEVEGMKNPMSSIRGQVMASMGLSGDVKEEVEEAAKAYVMATASDREKAKMAKEGKRLANILGK